MEQPALTWERRDPASQVLIVTNMWPDDERPVYGIFVKRQVESLLRSGVRCDVLYVRGYRSPFVYLRAAVWFALSSLGLRGRYRLIHAHAGETGLVARFHCGAPVLVSYCGDDLLGNPGGDGGVTLQSRLRSLVLRQHARLFSATVTKSAAMERALPATTRPKNLVVPNGVDVRLFHPIPRNEARRQLAWKSHERVALFGATKPWAPGKRLWLAESACEHAERQLGSDIRLEVAQNVAPERMPLLMSAADCLLVTSAIEGSPNTVKEALMCNLPVIATPAGDIEVLLQSVKPSYLCAPDAPQIGRALADCLAARQRSNGRAVVGWLSDEAIAARLIELYRSLAEIEPFQNLKAPAP